MGNRMPYPITLDHNGPPSPTHPTSSSPLSLFLVVFKTIIRYWDTARLKTPTPRVPAIRLCHKNTNFNPLFFSLATSNGTIQSLASHEGGHCLSSNMKMAIYVCLGTSGVKVGINRGFWVTDHLLLP